MSAKRVEFSGPYRRAAALELSLMLVGCVVAASACQGTAQQRRVCTPDVYRLCAGEIPDVRAITACLQGQKGKLSALAAPRWSRVAFD